MEKVAALFVCSLAVIGLVLARRYMNPDKKEAGAGVTAGGLILLFILAYDMFVTR